MRLYGSHPSRGEAPWNPCAHLCKAGGGRRGGDVPLTLSGSSVSQKTCISAEIHIGKWISQRKHCFSLREAFNPLKFLSNLPWKSSSRA